MVKSEANLTRIRNFDLQLSREQPKVVYNGSHPGKGSSQEVNDKRFNNTHDKLCSGSKYRRTNRGDHDWVQHIEKQPLNHWIKK